MHANHLIATEYLVALDILNTIVAQLIDVCIYKLSGVMYLLFVRLVILV